MDGWDVQAVMEIFDQVRYIPSGLTTYLSSYITCLKNCPGYLYDANIIAYSERHLGILRWSPHPPHLPLLSFPPIQEARPHSPFPLRECLDALHPTPVYPIYPNDLISPKAYFGSHRSHALPSFLPPAYHYTRGSHSSDLPSLLLPNPLARPSLFRCH